MKRLISALVAVTALATPASAGGAARIESFDYNIAGQAGIAGYGAWLGAACAGEACIRGMSNMETLKDERAVKVKIADVSGASVKGIIVQKGTKHEFCGSSGRVPIKGGKPIAIYVSAHPCTATPDGVVTTGTVTAKFID
jgi:hypothetical protein